MTSPVEDQHAGHGGSYVVDKKGKRQLVERTQPDVGTANATEQAQIATQPVGATSAEIEE